MIMIYNCTPIYGSVALIDVPTGVYMKGLEIKGQVSVTKDDNGNITNLVICAPSVRLEISQ